MYNTSTTDSDGGNNGITSVVSVSVVAGVSQSGPSDALKSQLTTRLTLTPSLWLKTSWILSESLSVQFDLAGRLKQTSTRVDIKGKMHPVDVKL